MFAVTGITGKVGGAVARALLTAGRPVKAVVRNPEKASRWIDEGCSLAVANMNDADALAEAFASAEGVFVVVPPMFDPSPGFPEAKTIFAALNSALEKARPNRVVCLSSIGAQATHPNLLNQLGLMEQTLRNREVPIGFLRAAWFMENFAADIDPARIEGVFRSFLHPLDNAFPMVASSDIGSTAAALLQAEWAGSRIVEIEGPLRITPNDVAAALSRAVHRNVVAQVVPRDQWEMLFRSQGMKNPTPRVQMLNGFNEGWIEFAGAPIPRVRGVKTLDQVLLDLVKADR